MSPQKPNDRRARIKQHLERTVESVLSAVQLDDRGSHRTTEACARAEVALANLRDEVASMKRDAVVVGEKRASYEDRISLH